MFELHWPYFFVGLFVYVLARIIYTFAEKRKHSHKRFDENEKGDFKMGEEEKEEVKVMFTEAELNNSPFENLNEETNQTCFSSHEDMPHIPFSFERLPENVMIKRSAEFYKNMNKRRSVRKFNREPVAIDIIYNIIKTSGTSPSSAHIQPWNYVLVKSPEVKQQIRDIIEKEEELNYKKRMNGTEFLLYGTDWITDAAYLILVFKQTYSSSKNEMKNMHHYNEISVSLGAGLLLAAIQNAGLVSLTSTPLGCAPALRNSLNRPKSEKLMLLLAVGYPAEDCLIPDLKRKPLEDILVEL